MNKTEKKLSRTDLQTMTRQELENLILELQSEVHQSTTDQVDYTKTTDIPDHTLYEESLLEREERLTALMNHNPSLIFLKDERGRYVYLNNSYERQFVDTKSWYGKTDFDFWPKESAELFIKDDRLVLESGVMQQFLEDSTDKEGKRYCWLCYKFPFTDSKGKKFVGGIGFNATERVIAQEALLESEERYRTLVRYAAAGIYEVDFTTGQLTDVNDAMCLILGYTREELLTLPASDHLDEESKNLFLNRVKLAQTGQQLDNNVEYRIRKKGGQLIWGLFNSRFRWENGKIAGASVIAHDITERKQAETALRESEQKYRRQAEELATVNKELESFSYSISHDLRAPIQAMKGLCSIMMEDYSGKLEPELQNYLKRIVTSSDKMGELVDDMLNLSKISRQEMNVQQISLSKIAETIIDELQQSDPAKNVEVSIAQDVETRGDSGLMSIALSNLIGNAWKYSSKTPNAHIEFGEMFKDGETIYYVRDNGAGFNMKFANKLFEPFKRLHSDKEFSGTGIGLAIVKRVIEKHHGKVWAESEPGKGATFFFTLSLTPKDSEDI
jgi:PAS domain S-box-containing protein